MTNIETPSQRRVNVRDTGVQKPAGAVASAFQMGRGNLPPRTKQDAPDPDSVRIRSGVPLPPPLRGKNATSAYQTILAHLKPGDSIVLPVRQGKSLISRARRDKVPIAIRRDGADNLAIWKLDDQTAAAHSRKTPSKKTR